MCLHFQSYKLKQFPASPVLFSFFGPMLLGNLCNIFAQYLYVFLHNVFEGSLLESSFQVPRLVSGIGDLVNCDLILNQIYVY